MTKSIVVSCGVLLERTSDCGKKQWRPTTSSSRSIIFNKVCYIVKRPCYKMNTRVLHISGLPFILVWKRKLVVSWQVLGTQRILFYIYVVLWRRCRMTRRCILCECFDFCFVVASLLSWWSFGFLSCFVCCLLWSRQ